MITSHLPQFHFIVFDGFTPGIFAVGAVLLSHAITEKKRQKYILHTNKKKFACVFFMQRKRKHLNFVNGAFPCLTGTLYSAKWMQRE